MTSSPSEVHSTLTKSILHMKGSGSGTLGAGDVDLGPKARCDVSKMGAGDVRCGG